MKLSAYSIYDFKALQYHTPYFCVADGVAVRLFQDLVQDPQSNISRHPTDYSLWYLGEYDDRKGSMEPVSPLRHVVDGAALVSQQSKLPLEGEGQ